MGELIAHLLLDLNLGMIEVNPEEAYTPDYDPEGVERFCGG